MKRRLYAAGIALLFLITSCNYGTETNTTVEDDPVETRFIKVQSNELGTYYMDPLELTRKQWTTVCVWASSHGYTFLENYLQNDETDYSNEPINVYKEDYYDTNTDQIPWDTFLVWCNAASELDGIEPVYFVEGTTDFTDSTKVLRECRYSGTYDEFNIVFNNNANGYRIPTLDEWIYAAKAGTNYIYSGSDTLDEVAWYYSNSKRKLQLGGLLKPNKWGFYDMSGNLSELVLIDSNKENCLVNGNYTFKGGDYSSGPGFWGTTIENLKIDYNDENNSYYQGCRLTTNSNHQHQWEVKKDENSHWLETTCTSHEKITTDKTPHGQENFYYTIKRVSPKYCDYDNPDGYHKKLCYCIYECTEFSPRLHYTSRYYYDLYNEYIVYDENQHYNLKKCQCCDYFEEGTERYYSHSYSSMNIVQSPCKENNFILKYKCNQCPYTRTLQCNEVSSDFVYNESNRGLYIAKTETTYSRWYQIYEWATKNGYDFCSDSTRITESERSVCSPREGSEGTPLAKPTPGCNQPVINISVFDVMLWCNAASEMEGLEPVFKLYGEVFRSFDKYLTKYKEIHPGCNWFNFQIGDVKDDGTRYHSPFDNGITFNVKANGYYFGNIRNFYVKGTYDYAINATTSWLEENSEGKTHEVGLLQPTKQGIYDLYGNVLEMALDITSVNYFTVGVYSQNEKNYANHNSYVSNGLGSEVFGFRLLRTIFIEGETYPYESEFFK